MPLALTIGGIVFAFFSGWSICSLMSMAKLTDLDSANAELARQLDEARATEYRLREKIAAHVREGLKDKETTC